MNGHHDMKQTRRLLVKLKKWLPLVIILVVLTTVLSTGLHHYLSFESLAQHREILLSWTKAHFFWVSLYFMMIYTLAVAVSVPGAAFLTLVGGFLFGPVWGSIYVIFSATLGATLLYLAVKNSLGQWFSEQVKGSISKMRQGFQDNAFSYLLFLRLIPLFPFWIINIVPALLGVGATTYILATLIGIIPGSIIYVWVGHGLSHVFATNQSPNLSIIFEPKIFYPLLALALMSLSPIIYQKFFKKPKD